MGEDGAAGKGKATNKRPASEALEGSTSPKKKDKPAAARKKSLEQQQQASGSSSKVKEEGAKKVNADESSKGKGKKNANNEANQNSSSAGQIRRLPNGLEIIDLAMGKAGGKLAANGKRVYVKYVGRLKKTGQVFDKSKKPFSFRLGVGEVISGWDIGVKGMRVGDKRRLTVPPSLGYGKQRTGPIPPNSTLVFDVELIDVR